MSQHDENILDMAMINGLKQLQIPEKPDFLSFLVGVFVETSTEHAKKIRHAANSKNFDLLSDMSHSLKSSAANLGAHRLAKVCHELESLAKSSNIEQLTFQMQVFEREHEAAIFALTRLQKAS